MKPYELRGKMKLHDYNTTITKEDFERDFYRTNEKITFTFNGWDGKSYDGETRTARVIRTRIEGYESARLIKVGKGLHYIDEDKLVTEKATGEQHNEAEWLIDIQR